VLAVGVAWLMYLRGLTPIANRLEQVRPCRAPILAVSLVAHINSRTFST